MYTKQTNSASFSAGRPSGESVRLAVGDGAWMTMAQAILMTGLSERTLRRHMSKGLLKFKRKGKQHNSPVELWITPEIGKFAEQNEPESGDDGEVIEIFDATPEYSEETANDVEGSSGAGPARQTEPDSVLMLRMITDQFFEKLEKKNEILLELKTEIQDKDRQLKLLPDLEKLADERQLAELKAIALEKQIEELKQLNEQLKQQAETAEEKVRLSQEKKSWWKMLFTGGGES